MDDELLDLVDQNDQVIGKEWRSNVHAKGLSNFRVIYTFVHNAQGQLWIPRRTAHKKLWPLRLDVGVGGHVGSGETYDEAFVREVQEEINLDVHTTTYQKLGRLTPHEHGVGFFITVYTVLTNQSPDYNKDDFIEFYWLYPHEVLERLETIDVGKPDLAKLIKYFFIHPRQKTPMAR